MPVLRLDNTKLKLFHREKVNPEYVAAAAGQVNAALTNPMFGVLG